MARPKRIRLGELLVQKEKISAEQLTQAIDEQKKQGGKIGQIMVNLGFLTEDDMLAFLAEQIEIPLVELKHHNFDKELIRLLPVNYARRFRAIILGRDDSGDLLIGMADPLDLLAYDELTRIVNQPISLALVREKEVLHAIDLLYRHTDEIEEFAQDLKQELTDTIDIADIESEDAAASQPVVKLLQSLFEDALQVHASDIHIEPDEHVLRIRQRVDGVLTEHIINEKNIAAALSLRLKLMGGMNISEKRLPQDGRFNIKVKDKKVDVRLSTMPVEYGESVVMRLLDQSAVALDLRKTGMPEDMLKDFERNMRRPYGMILVTGPTGSGKTTTLYSVLAQLNSPEKKIITVEDPVEYRLERISQVQVNTKIDLDFARVLRTALRQDPDIILVGEIRDQETASIAIRAALTGHLVLASLHTNDATSTAIRLIDMGVEGYLVGTALRVVLAQRLVRRICDTCAEIYQASEGERAWAIAVGGEKYKDIDFRRGRGCTYCNNTGFRGRVGIFELFELDTAMIAALSDNDPNAFTQATEKHKANNSLSLSALKAAARGDTTVSEALRIAGEFDDSFVEEERKQDDDSSNVDMDARTTKTETDVTNASESGSTKENTLINESQGTSPTKLTLKKQ